MQSAVLAAIGRPGDREDAVVELDLHVAADHLRQLALRPVHGHATGREVDGDARGDLDWLVTYAAHC